MATSSVAWGSVAKASLVGVGAAWLAFAIVTGFSTFIGPSSDIAMAFYPAAIMVALAVALLLFWPLVTLIARFGTNLSTTQSWARHWLAWLVVGAAICAPTLVAFFAVLSGGLADASDIWWIGALTGAFAATVTYWRLGIRNGD